MSDPSSKTAYEAALLEHANETEPAVRRLEAAIEQAANSDADPAALVRLRTMRVLLLSGLFDAQFYLDRNPDVREARIDPIEHYVGSGEREGRMPNPAFIPGYYRRQYMDHAAAEQNALRHYIEEGEISGARPNIFFDPREYLAASPGLSAFVDRPLFHYLRIGQAAAEMTVGASSSIVLRAMDYVATVERIGFEQHDLLMAVKRALIDDLGLSDGFALYRKLINRPDHTELHLKQLASLREFASTGLCAFQEIARAGEPFVVQQPTVIGAGNHRAMEGRTRSMFVACLIDARVRSRSNIIEVDDVVLLDYQGDELARYDDRLYCDPAIFHATRDAAWVMTPPSDAPTIEIEEAFTLLGIYAGAFGHWMIDFLPKYVAASLSGALPNVPILIGSGMPASHRQALELMLPQGGEIIELQHFSSARVRRLWCASTVSYLAMLEVRNERFKWDYFALPPARFAPIIREMARRTDAATARPTGVERVFLARESFRHHKLTNHSAIAAAAEARGFLVVYPELLHFTEQARLLRHARFVLGPSGSAMFLAFFAQPATRLCLLSSVEDVADIGTELFGPLDAIGIDVTVFTGACLQVDTDIPANSDFVIEEEAFCRFLDEWLADCGRSIQV